MKGLASLIELLLWCSYSLDFFVREILNIWSEFLVSIIMAWFFLNQQMLSLDLSKYYSNCKIFLVLLARNPLVIMQCSALSTYVLHCKFYSELQFGNASNYLEKLFCDSYAPLSVITSEKESWLFFFFPRHYIFSDIKDN